MGKILLWFASSIARFIVGSVFIAACVAFGFGPDEWVGFMIEALPHWITPNIARSIFILLGILTLAFLIASVVAGRKRKTEQLTTPEQDKQPEEPEAVESLENQRGIWQASADCIERLKELKPEQPSHIRIIRHDHDERSYPLFKALERAFDKAGWMVSYREGDFDLPSQNYNIRVEIIGADKQLTKRIAAVLESYGIDEVRVLPYIILLKQGTIRISVLPVG